MALGDLVNEGDAIVSVEGEAASGSASDGPAEPAESAAAPGGISEFLMLKRIRRRMPLGSKDPPSPATCLSKCADNIPRSGDDSISARARPRSS